MLETYSNQFKVKIAFIIVLIGLLLSSLNCASVPKEAVELSYIMGQDIQQLHNGYSKTVKSYFEQLRQRGLNVIDNVWLPVYLKESINSSDLFNHLNDMSFSEAERYGDLEYWAIGALKDIGNKRREFLDSLKQREDILLISINNAFTRVIRVNATITGHLHSIVKVKELQDDILKSVGLKEIRDQINDGIDEASKFTSKATKSIEDASKILKETQ